jgi:hypothetical protein
MKSILIKSPQLARQAEAYLTDAEFLIAANFKLHKQSQAFKDLYKSCLAITTVLKALDSPSRKPRLKGLTSIALRLPLLVAAGQSSVAKVELRRFVEISLWSLYFSDHPIEWQNFEGKRDGGFTTDPHLPISFAAHRELNSYFEYAAEFLKPEPSGVSRSALNLLQNDKRALNAAVHAGEIAKSAKRIPPLDDFSENRLKREAALATRVFRHCIILLAASDKGKFDRLPATPRAYFDWMVGNDLGRRIRAGIFGIARTL